MTEHKARPEPWQEDAARWLDAILELRARVEALEANSSAPLTSYNYPAKPDSSLVEKVAYALRPYCSHLAQTDARIAIREVAAWMTSNPDVYFPPALVFALEQEAER